MPRFPLLSLPAGGVYVASEPKEDCVHFLVLTDVCGNRSMPWLPSTPDPCTYVTAVNSL